MSASGRDWRDKNNWVTRAASFFITQFSQHALSEYLDDWQRYTRHCIWWCLRWQQMPWLFCFGHTCMCHVNLCRFHDIMSVNCNKFMTSFQERVATFSKHTHKLLHVCYEVSLESGCFLVMSDGGVRHSKYTLKLNNEPHRFACRVR